MITISKERNLWRFIREFNQIQTPCGSTNPTTRSIPNLKTGAIESQIGHAVCRDVQSDKRHHTILTKRFREPNDENGRSQNCFGLFSEVREATPVTPSSLSRRRFEQKPLANLCRILSATRRRD